MSVPHSWGLPWAMEIPSWLHSTPSFPTLGSSCHARGWAWRYYGDSKKSPWSFFKKWICHKEQFLGTDFVKYGQQKPTGRVSPELLHACLLPHLLPINTRWVLLSPVSFNMLMMAGRRAGRRCHVAPGTGQDHGAGQKPARGGRGDQGAEELSGHGQEADWAGKWITTW